MPMSIGSFGTNDLCASSGFDDPFQKNNPQEQFSVTGPIPGFRVLRLPSPPLPRAAPVPCAGPSCRKNKNIFGKHFEIKEIKDFHLFSLISFQFRGQSSNSRSSTRPRYPPVTQQSHNGSKPLMYRVVGKRLGCPYPSGRSRHV